MTGAQATSGRFIERSRLTGEESSAMYALLGRHFEGVTVGQFQSDINQKNWIILIERDRRLVGFSTLLAYQTVVGGAPLSVICSGDTIVAPEAWNSPALAKAWIECVAMLRNQYHRGRYLWLLITSGFRTYRFLPVFWREFYPRYDAPTPVACQSLMNELAHERFGSAYDAAAGVVRFSQPQRLCRELAMIPSGREQDPHVSFFASRNPGHARGDELVCLTELTPVNLSAAGRRMAAGVRQW